MKREIKETELGITFAGETIEVDPEERRQQALETAEYLAKMAPKILKRGKNGKALIYGENN